MVDMPDMVSKPAVFAKLEKRYRDPELRRQSLRRLRRTTSAQELISAGSDHRTQSGKLAGEPILDPNASNPSFPAPVDQGAHVLQDWFGDGWGWTAPNRADITCRALIETIETLNRLEKRGGESVPLQMLWICVPDPNKFEVSVFWTDAQVTTVFVTGPVPMPGPDASTQRPVDRQRKRPGWLIVRNDEEATLEVVGPTLALIPSGGAYGSGPAGEGESAS